jgi:cytochrome c2
LPTTAGLLIAFLLFATAAIPVRAESGQAEFRRYCAICHSSEPGHNKVGPSLAGVVGRRAGSVPDFIYSSANKTSGIVWTKKKLDAYLANPQAVVPGTAMMFPGIKNSEDRHALIDYLASLPAD